MKFEEFKTSIDEYLQKIDPKYAECFDDRTIEEAFVYFGANNENYELTADELNYICIKAIPSAKNYIATHHCSDSVKWYETNKIFAAFMKEHKTFIKKIEKKLGSFE